MAIIRLLVSVRCVALFGFLDSFTESFLDLLISADLPEQRL
ncbi:MAG: hypothetical protein NTV57_00840 [Cyanobacteria bacterium]|nr:hypothetical protein [Cyanobacteriota bacterium]